MKEYIGDSVYADYEDPENLKLTTENGFGATNTVILEPEVVKNLIEFIKRNPLIVDYLERRGTL